MTGSWKRIGCNLHADFSGASLEKMLAGFWNQLQERMHGGTPPKSGEFIMLFPRNIYPFSAACKPVYFPMAQPIGIPRDNFAPCSEHIATIYLLGYV